MKAKNIKSERPFIPRNDKSLGVQTYGENNDFPQIVSRIVGASCTGKSCLSVYAKFVAGQGFCDKDLQSLVVNRDGQKLGEILKAAAGDLTKYNGFALLVNYNAACRIVEVYHVPFEHLRFEKIDTETGKFHKIAEHDDWAREFEALKRFKKQDIVFYDLFDPDPEAIEEQVADAGGWDVYRGQVLYYSGDGPLTYPTPIYEPELTDMRTEEAVSNIVGRNAANGFFPAGMLVDINNEDQSEEAAEATIAELRRFQGDENGAKVMYLQVRSKEEVPVFVPLAGENYDKAFTQTQGTIPANIGRIFNQPPILRAEDVGANFGADLMVNAYNYYNSVTYPERQVLAEVFRRVFDYWQSPVDGDFIVAPLAYVSGRSLYARLGEAATSKVYDIANNEQMTDEAKVAMMTIGYDLTEEEAWSIVNPAKRETE